MRELLEFSRCGIDERGFGLEEMADAEDLVVGLFPALQLDRLADGGDRLDAVAGVETRGIDLVLEPGPPGQALRIGEPPLALDELFVQRAKGGGGAGRAPTSARLRR